MPLDRSTATCAAAWCAFLAFVLAERLNWQPQLRSSALPSSTAPTRALSTTPATSASPPSSTQPLPTPLSPPSPPTLSWTSAAAIARGGRPVLLRGTPADAWSLGRVGWSPQVLAGRLQRIPGVWTSNASLFTYYDTTASLTDHLLQRGAWSPTYENLPTPMRVDAFFAACASPSPSGPDEDSKKKKKKKKKTTATQTTTTPDRFVYYTGEPADGDGVIIEELKPYDGFVVPDDTFTRPRKAAAEAATGAEEAGAKGGDRGSERDGWRPGKDFSSHRVNMWIGCTGVTMNTHYDTSHNFSVHLHGRKRFVLTAPGAPSIRPYPKGHPHFRGAQPIEGQGGDFVAELEPGDVM